MTALPLLRSSSVPCARIDPDLVIVAVGLDAHTTRSSDMAVSADGFGRCPRRCAALAPRVAGVLEGGYNLKTLPDLVEAVLEGFVERPLGTTPFRVTIIFHRQRLLVQGLGSGRRGTTR